MLACIANLLCMSAVAGAGEAAAHALARGEESGLVKRLYAVTR